MSKYTEAARGQPCQIRIPGVCNRDDSTVVLCHKPGAGMGLKSHDIHAAFGCHACHDEVDRRTRKVTREYAMACFFEGMVRTQLIWITDGILKP